MTESSSAIPRRLVGKKAIVTAAAQGIGNAIALRLAQEGAEVIACDINAEKLKKIQHPGITVSAFDASDEAAANQALATAGPVDILVNCVGGVFHGTILETDYADWTLSFKINVDSAYFAIRSVLPGMLAVGKGSIVNMSSAASSVKGFPNRVAYGATKAAIIGLTKAIAVDHVGAGIRCNAICPGTVASPSLDERINAFADPVAARAAFIARQPMGRLGTPEEIASLAAYMASDESSYMTGAIVNIDGGAVN